MKRQRREWRLCGDLCGRGVVWWVWRLGGFSNKWGHLMQMGGKGEDALCCWFGGVLALKEMELCTAWFFGEMGGGERDGDTDLCV